MKTVGELNARLQKNRGTAGTNKTGGRRGSSGDKKEKEESCSRESKMTRTHSN